MTIFQKNFINSRYQSNLSLASLISPSGRCFIDRSSVKEVRKNKISGFFLGLILPLLSLHVLVKIGLLVLL